LTIGLTALQEAALFVDINDNLMSMNTSHLYHLLTTFTPLEDLASDNPALWIANKLAEDPKSPFHGIVYLGGENEKVQGLDRRVNLAALRTGVQMILKDNIKLRDEAFNDILKRYVIIRTYWSAVAKTFAQEWADAKEYLLLRGFGVWCMSILGADIIDRCLIRSINPSQFEEEMSAYLRQISRDVNWHRKEGNLRHYGGRVGARELADKMRRFLSDEDVDMAKIARDLESLY